MTDIDPVRPEDKLPRPPNLNRIEDVLVEFVDMSIEEGEGRRIDIGPVPAPAGMRRDEAIRWAAEVYYPQVVEPKAKFLLDQLGHWPAGDPIAAATIRALMRHRS